jgi:hypothetical protein
VYGAPNIHAELAHDHGIRVGRKRVARLMRAAGLRGATLRWYILTTQPDWQASRAVDLVDRQFYTDAPDRLWVAYITYIPTWSGFLYLAMVLDVYSRRVVGWSMETHLRTELILAALNMALTQRRPSEVIHHSDRGCQGGFKWSLQHFNDGGCDDISKTAVGLFRTRQVVLAGPADGRACGATAVLGRDCGGALERASSSSRSGIVAGWSTLVSGGWRHAAIASKAVDATAVGTISVVCGARTDRSSAREGPWGSPDRAPTGTGSLDDLAGVAPQCCHTQQGP